MSDAVDGMRDPRKLRVRVGLTFVRTLRPALYVLLVASALLTFWAGGGIGGRELPRWAASAAPVFFAVFLVVFAVYRLALVRAKKYPAAMGLFQIGLGALVWVLLLPGTRQGIGREQGDDVQVLRIVGQDATPGGEGPAAQRRWREVLRARGLLR